MSLILEALKKSEAERRLGRAPDLLTPAARAAEPRRGSWLAGFAIGLAGALLLAALTWWWFTSGDVVPTQTAQLPAPVNQAGSSSPAPQLSVPTTPTPPPTAATPPIRTPAETISNVPLPQDPDFAGIERESVPVPAQAIPLPPPAPAPESRVAPAAPAATTPRPAAPAMVTVPEGPAEDIRAAASLQAPPDEPALEALQHLSTLAASEREGLPPLRLSMHVYNDEPALRFVLIDGKRYRQGDAIVTGVVIDTIRPDGVAIAHRNRRFLISRP